MIAAVIETLELRREGQALIADVERTEVTAPNAQIRLSWNATKRPHGFKQVGGGVAFIQSDGEFQVSHYTSQPDVLEGDHFAWRDTAHAERMILIVLLPEGAGINAESLLPRPQRAKTFNGRLAVYWELSPTEHDVAWEMSASSASAIDAAVRAINRGAVKQRSVEHAPSPNARVASLNQKTSESDAKPPRAIARWVGGVVAVCSGASTIYGLFTDKRVAVIGFLGMVFAVVLLLVVHRAIRAVTKEKAGFYDIIVKVLILFVVLYFMVLTCVLFPALVTWLTTGVKETGHGENSSSPSPSPSSSTRNAATSVDPFLVTRETMNDIGNGTASPALLDAVTAVVTAYNDPQWRSATQEWLNVAYSTNIPGYAEEYHAALVNGWSDNWKHLGFLADYWTHYHTLWGIQNDSRYSILERDSRSALAFGIAQGFGNVRMASFREYKDALIKEVNRKITETQHQSPPGH